MTTGQWDKSTIVPYQDPAVGDFLGEIHWKTWSGTNNPPRVKKPKEVYWIVKRIPEQARIIRKGKNAGKVIRKPEVQKWRLVRRRFWDPPPKRQSTEQHPYTMTYVKYTSADVAYVNTPGVTQTTHTILRMQGITSTYSGGVLGSDWNSNDDLRLMNKLKERLSGSDFNASVSLGEGAQTLKLIADTAIRIRKALIHLRRGDIAGTARSLLDGTSRRPLKPYDTMGRVVGATPEMLSRHWLELQYGWKPLLSDCEAAAQMLAHQLSVPLEMKVTQSLTKRVAGHVRTDIENYYGSPQTYIKPPGIWVNNDPKCRTWRTTWNRLERKRKTVIMTERPSTWAVLGLTDPAQVLWELTPWSFVADWFIPIGQYLDARGLGSIYVGTWVESYKKVGVASGPVITTTSGFWSQSSGPQYVKRELGTMEKGPSEGGVGMCKYVSYSRTVNTSGPSVPLPTFKPLAKVASWQHCANAVALLTQQFAGGRVSGRSGMSSD